VPYSKFNLRKKRSLAVKISFTRVPILLETGTPYYLPHASCLTVDAELELPKSIVHPKALVTLTSDPDCRFRYKRVGLEVSSHSNAPSTARLLLFCSSSRTLETLCSGAHHCLIKDCYSCDF